MAVLQHKRDYHTSANCKHNSLPHLLWKGLMLMKHSLVPEKRTKEYLSQYIYTLELKKKQSLPLPLLRTAEELQALGTGYMTNTAGFFLYLSASTA